MRTSGSSRTAGRRLNIRYSPFYGDCENDEPSLDPFGRGVKDHQGFGVTETTVETAT